MARIIFLALLISFSASADLQVKPYLSAPAHSEAETLFNHELEENLKKVNEIRFIKAWSERHGFRVYLFGGSATAFGMYSLWNKDFQAGDHRFAPSKFDFRLPHIIHFNQDVDILIDGNTEQAQALQNALVTQFPYEKTTGGKTIPIWEVRPLEHPIGLKASIWGNSDFRDQNTDSGSTGLIEISDSAPQVSRIQDIRSQRPEEGRFAQDLLARKITFYETGLHLGTSRAAGANPELIGALRFLIKVFQYDLNTDARSMDSVARIIRDADYNAIRAQRGSRRWIEKNAAKLFENSLDLEKAWAILNRLHVLDPLKTFAEDGTIKGVDWWMSQRPVLSFPMGKGNLPTAGELKLKTLFLKVKDFDTFERLSMGSLKPNLFAEPVSFSKFRTFGVTLATTSPRSEEIAVAFDLAPESRLGSDFVRVSEGEFSVFNLQSLQVVPESLILPRERLFSLISDRIDPNFISYIIREYEMFSNLDEKDCARLRDIANKRLNQNGELYKKVLLPLLVRREQANKLVTAEGFIRFVEELRTGKLDKPQIAQFVIDNLDSFYASKPTFSQIHELKIHVRHGPPFTTFMTRAMEEFVTTPAQYLRLIEFDETDITPKYQRRMSDFIFSSYDSFLALHPSEEEIRTVLKRLPQAQREEIIHRTNCADILGDLI